MKFTTIELFKEAMKFSAAHFTIFSSTERERLHGHNFTVHAEIKAEINDNGITFDYGLYKEKILELCRSLNEYLLLPTLSPYLAVRQIDQEVHAIFAKEKLVFLARDVRLLPIRNITVEELASWFLEQLVQSSELKNLAICGLVIKVFSGPGQSGSASWGAFKSQAQSSDEVDDVA